MFPLSHQIPFPLSSAHQKVFGVAETLGGITKSIGGAMKEKPDPKNVKAAVDATGSYAPVLSKVLELVGGMSWVSELIVTAIILGTPTWKIMLMADALYAGGKLTLNAFKGLKSILGTIYETRGAIGNAIGGVVGFAGEGVKRGANFLYKGAGLGNIVAPIFNTARKGILGTLAYGKNIPGEVLHAPLNIARIMGGTAAKIGGLFGWDAADKAGDALWAKGLQGFENTASVVGNWGVAFKEGAATSIESTIEAWASLGGSNMSKRVREGAADIYRKIPTIKGIITSTREEADKLMRTLSPGFLQNPEPAMA